MYLCGWFFAWIRCTLSRVGPRAFWFRRMPICPKNWRLRYVSDAPKASLTGNRLIGAHGSWVPGVEGVEPPRVEDYRIPVSHLMQGKLLR